jgi:hypothetical protein
MSIVVRVLLEHAPDLKLRENTRPRVALATLQSLWGSFDRVSDEVYGLGAAWGELPPTASTAGR